MQNQTLLARIGGPELLATVVDKFYDKIVADDLVKGFYKGIDMKKLRADQTAFLTKCFGGPDNYHGRNMADSHQHLKLNEAHFNRIIELLAGTFKEHGVSDQLIGEIGAIAMTTKGDIIYKGA